MTVASPYAEQLARIPVQMHRLTLLGSDTAYWDYGDADAPVTIVMVHGFRGDHHGLEPVVAQLEGVRVIAPDLPGFGESTRLLVMRHDIVGYATWLRAFVDQLGICGRLIILGHSFGSIIVAKALADGLNPIDSLSPAEVILVNPIAANALAGPRGVMTRLAVLYYRVAAALPEKLGFALLRSRIIVRIMSVTMAKTRDKALRAFIHDQHDRYFSAFDDRRVVLEAFEASVSHDVSEYAPAIGQRTQLIAAENDDISSVAAQRRLAPMFADASLYVIPEVGHLIHYETPQEAADVITTFLSRSTPHE